MIVLPIAYLFGGFIFFSFFFFGASFFMGLASAPSPFQCAQCLKSSTKNSPQ